MYIPPCLRQNCIIEGTTVNRVLLTLITKIPLELYMLPMEDKYAPYSFVEAIFFHPHLPQYLHVHILTEIRMYVGLLNICLFYNPSDQGVDSSTL